MAFSIRDPSLPLITHEKFGLFTGYMFTINCIIGAGFLSIPYAFQTAGWLFCLVYQIIATVQTYYTSMQVLEIMSRAEILIRMTEDGRDIHRISYSKLFYVPQKSEKLNQNPHLTPTITHRQINLPDAVKLVFGEKVGFTYLIALCIYQLGTMVAYASIFSSSFTSTVPLGNLDTCDIYETSSFFTECKGKYWIYLFIFGVFTVYMTVMGLEEQHIVQVIMSILRFFVMICIIMTCSVDISKHESNESDSYNEISWPPLIDIKKVAQAVPILLFALTFQLQMPIVMESMTNKTQNLKIINILAILTCFVLYTIIGIVVPLAIKDIDSLASLSYRNYSAGYSNSDRPMWTYLIEYLIVLSPALDVASTFPLQGLTCSGALHTWIYGHGSQIPPKFSVYIFRFLVAFIPLFIAFLEYDLGVILDWVGLVGFLIVQFTIPLLHIGLRHMVSDESVYDVSIHPIFSWMISISNIMLFFVVIGMNGAYSY